MVITDKSPDGDAPPAEETDQEADSTTTKGGEAGNSGDESQRRDTGENKSNTKEQNEPIDKTNLSAEEIGNVEQHHEEL